jgi:hypothetical protein
MKEMRRPAASATTPVGTSKMTIPAVNAAFATNASVSESPASSKNRVLIPQISEAANVWSKRRVMYVL